ncbi:MAG: hypothetical protein JO266_20180 [Acidobacteria bacterium]|nr:hypothetical protein [Acidobacteriota bacterium]MBV9483608.1 hypothetical protein [Acidobacteriota bacterium]
MTTVELDDAERAALITLLKQTIAADPFPMSVRSKLLRRMLAKLKSGSEPAGGAQSKDKPR